MNPDVYRKGYNQATVTAVKTATNVVMLVMIGQGHV
jgi:hypothetical protein